MKYLRSSISVGSDGSSNWGSNGGGDSDGNGFLVDVGLGSDFGVNVRFSFNFFMDIRFSCDFFMDVGFGFDFGVDVGFSFNFLMDVGFGGNFFVDVGFGSGVNLTGVVIRVYGGDGKGSGLGIGGIGQRLGGIGVGGISGISIARGGYYLGGGASRDGGNQGENSDLKNGVKWLLVFDFLSFLK